jgi:hypothetical protein
VNERGWTALRQQQDIAGVLVAHHEVVLNELSAIGVSGLGFRE